MSYRHDLIIGIDPGTKGGIAWFFPMARLGESIPATRHARKMSNMALGEIAELLSSLKRKASNPICYLENPKGIPYVGKLPPELAMKRLMMLASSYGKLQRRVGHIEGILAGLEIPVELVSPQKWMKKLDCETGGDKKITREKAWRLYPQLKPTHDTADAILIMHYGSLESYSSGAKSKPAKRVKR